MTVRTLLSAKSCLKVASYVLAVLLTSLPQNSDACFLEEGIFKYHQQWLQTTSLHSYRQFEVVENGDMLLMREKGTVKEIRCTRAYADNRYQVKIDDSEFQCLKFTALTPRVVRKSHTQGSRSHKKIDCMEEEEYEEEEALLIAYNTTSYEQCPLSGGYQLIVRDGVKLTDPCVNSVNTYNPRVQFQCDGPNSGNVLFDLGKSCQPLAFTNISQSLTGGHMLRLNCFGQWQEDGLNFLLLRMKDLPNVFWCLHYKPGQVSTNITENFLTVFMTFDGRCSSNNFDITKIPSMSASLASYVPEDDSKCQEKEYLERCSTDNSRKCLESTECPESCRRCQTKTTAICKFAPYTLGTWTLIGSDHQLEVTFEESKIKSPFFGEFICGTSPKTDQAEHMYRVVQTGAYSTCMAYYACTLTHSPAPNLLDFQLRRGSRDPNTGHVLPCENTDKHHGLDVWEKVVTLVKKDKLKAVACHQSHNGTFTTLEKCKLAIKACTGTCNVLTVGFDRESCDNVTMQTLNQTLKIETKHTCLAIVNLHDTIRGVITRSQYKGRYLCWLLGGSRLFVVPPEKCNNATVFKIFRSGESHKLYDPFKAISLPPSDADKVEDSANTKESCAWFLIVICTLIDFFLSW